MGSEETRNRILNVAMDLFSEHSYNQVTTKMIAQQSNISIGGLFHHFSSKLELAHAAYQKWWINFSQILSSDEFFNQSPRKALEIVITLFIDLYFTKPKIMRFLLELTEEAEKSDILQDSWKDVRKNLYQIIEDRFLMLGVPNPNYKAQLLNACLNGFMFQTLFLKENMIEITKEQLTKEIFELFLR
ncbi:MAG: TetR/AcrR family transcriptional regulator [Promethearchaeota archaeon]